MLANIALLCLAAFLTPADALALEEDNGVQGLESRTTKYTAKQVIKELGLIPNVEKGYFAETFRDAATYDNRSVSTAIYYLLEGSAGKSIWHRVDASEVWHYYAGAPLNLFLSNNDGRPTRKKVLGPEILRGQRPQVVIAADEWQQAQSQGAWTLVGTTVAPGFDVNGYELAEPGWKPIGA